MNNRTFGHLCAFMTILVWGTTFISTKVLLRAFSPVTILFLRFAAGYAALWCICPRRLVLAEKKREGAFALAGLCGVTLYFLFENIALTYTQASNVGVIISIAPFFTAIFSCLLLREGRPTLRFCLGFALAMGGIMLMSFGGGAALRLNPLGDLLAIGAAVLWAAYSTVMKRIGEFGCNTIQATRRVFFYGLVFMIPALFLLDFRVDLWRLADPVVVGNLLFLGLGASALCFVTWNFAVKVLGSVRTSVYIYLVPVITAAASALVLHETMTTPMICGMALAILGLFLSENRKKELAANGQ